VAAECDGARADVDEIRAAELADLVAPVVGPAPGDLREIRVELLARPKVAGLATVGIWRVRGAGWSVVLKLIHDSDDGDERWRSTTDPDHPFYWAREALAFRSGLLDQLQGGLRAPACYGVVDRDDGSVAVVMEDVTGEPAIGWPLERYGLAARHAGHAQGCLLDSAELGQSWLSRDWLRAYLDRRRNDAEILADSKAWTHPLVRSALPVERAVEFRDVWAAQGQLLDVLDSQPRTLCHLDVNPRNLFAVDDATVAIDWAFAGVGAMGEDMGGLAVDPVAEFDVAPDDHLALVQMLVEQYAVGLVSAGCDIDVQEVQRAVAAAAAAKYGWIVPSILSTAVTARPTMNGRPVAEAAPVWGRVGTLLLDLAKSALR
jgi:hypothetical protein